MLYTRPEIKKIMKLFGFGWPNEAYKNKVIALCDIHNFAKTYL